jgi:hypothetical protein
MQENGSSYGAEQFALNVYVYHFKNPIKDAGFEWNTFAHYGQLTCISEVHGEPDSYFLLPMRYKLVFGRRLGCKLDPFDGTGEIDVCILHMHSGTKTVSFPSNQSMGTFCNESRLANGQHLQVSKKLVSVYKPDFSDFDIPESQKRKLEVSFNSAKS